VNKKQLIARVQRYMGPGATRTTASAAVEAVLASIVAEAKNEHGVRIKRFGTFAFKSSSTVAKKDGRLCFRPSRKLAQNTSK
jgi:nucleoid DNA-binding protein